jgi:predicted nuclease with TOPRIM domain
MGDIKITEEEFKQLDELRQKTSALIFELGKSEVSALALKKEKERLEKEFNLIQEEENKTFNDLKGKYGSGYVDIADGKFIKSEDLNTIVMINSEINKNFN